MIGKTISHYKILEKIGEGGMGDVFKAEDTKLKRTVALKFLPLALTRDKDLKKRFIHEAQAASSLQHHNICTIHEIDETEEGQLFIAMDCYEGETVEERIKQSPLKVDEALDIIIQTAQGLVKAHQSKIIHRDIKSANIIVTTDGVVKIIDFGIAKLAGQTRVTKDGTSLGTASYMSPEQTLGKEVDHRTDIWSLGVVLYEMLTGLTPFQRDYEQAVVYSIINEEPKPLTSLRTGMPIELEQIVNKALAKDPNERYQHLDEFIVDLKQMKKEPEKYKTETPKWRLPAYIFGVVLIGLLLYKVWPGMKNVLQFRSVPSKQHLLVLPLADLSADSSKQAFCDGLAETMTSKLTQMEQFHGSLWVVPFSEVRSNRIKSSGEAYQYFGVNLVITGSIQFVSDVFRLTLNLVDAKNLRQINSAVIDIHSANIFSIQDQSIIKIMDMLRLRLNPKSSNVLQAGGTVIPKAYELYLQGRGYLQRGFESEKNYDLAIDFFRRATVEDSHYTIAYSAIGEAYWRKYEASEDQRLVEKALDACQKALEVDSTEISIYYTLGLIRAGTGRYDDAIRDFNRFLKGAPTDSEALIGLASAYQGKGLLDEAEKLFKNAINLKSDYWAGYSHLGVFYYRQNRYEDAINPFQRVIQLTPDNYNGYNNLGATYYMLERWSEAREMFEQAFNLREYYGVASNLGTLNFFEGKYADAARWFEKALEINDYDYLIWGNLASAYSMIPGRGDESVKKYQQAIIKGKLALNLNPNNATILARLAGYYASIGERSESLSFIDKSLLYSQNEASIFFEIGSTYETLGDREMAIQYLIEALKGGYSVSAIETDPMLSQLLTDKRFQQLRSF